MNGVELTDTADTDILNRPDFYSIAQDKALEPYFSAYPDIEVKSFIFEFRSNRAKNFVKVIKILKQIEKYHFNQDDLIYRIVFDNFYDVMANIVLLNELYDIIKNWVDFKIILNDLPFEKAHFHYLCNKLRQLYSKNNKVIIKNNPADILLRDEERKRQREQYLQNSPPHKFDIESCKKYIEEYCKSFSKYDIKKYSVSDLEYVFVVQDIFVFYAGIKNLISNNKYFSVIFEELTYNSFSENDLSKVNYTMSVNTRYRKFYGIHWQNHDLQNHSRYDNMNDYYESEFYRICQLLPQLNLIERYNEWQGFLYNFVIFEIQDISGNTARTIGYTQNKIHTFVLKVCKELEVKNWNSLKANGASSLAYSCSSDFIAALLSWKGTKSRKERLEENLTYFYIEQYQKEYRLLWKTARAILDKVNQSNEHFERGTYKKPINKWKSEELVYNIIKKLYKDCHIIYQHRPYFLKSTKFGQMSYDVFIAELDMAIEYQGKQHFEPVDFFGGELTHQAQVIRDTEKAQLSKEHNIKLVYINYWEDLTIDNIRRIISKALATL